MLISRLDVTSLAIILSSILMAPSDLNSQNPRAASTLSDSEQRTLDISSSMSNDSSYETSDADEEMSLSEMRKWKRIFEPSDSDLDSSSLLSFLKNVYFLTSSFS